MSTESPAADVKQPPRPKRSRRRKLCFGLLFGVVFFWLLVAVDHIAGRWFPPTPESLLFPSGSRVRHTSCEFEVRVEISSAGLRDREYAPGPPPGNVFRIAAVGDSFTFGWGVNSEEAWPNVLEKLLNEDPASTHGAKFEVLNFGYPGASPRDYEETAAKALKYFRPRMLIIGTLQGDDLIQLHEDNSKRSAEPPGNRIAETLFPTTHRWLRGRPPAGRMESYRETFLKTQHYVRSQFTPQQQARYTQLPPRVRECFESGMLNPSLIQRSMTKPEHFQLPERADDDWRTLATDRMRESLERIQTQCAGADCRLIVAVIPNGPYVSAAAAKGMRELGYDVPASLQKTDRPDLMVSNVCRRLEIPCLLSTAEFRKLKVEVYFPLDGHFNKTGHHIFARELLPLLRAHIRP